MGTRGRTTWLSVVGEILLTVGVVVGLFVVYQAWWTNIESGKLQSQVSGDLDRLWADENPRPLSRNAEGTAFARMFIPSFGPDFSYAVVEGTSDAALNTGPGHYSSTQLPGQPGNFAVAGHRVGRGAPFNDLGHLTTCDAVVVETASSWFVYRLLPVEDAPGADPVTRQTAAAQCLDEQTAVEVATGRYAGLSGRHITLPGDVGVLDPVPGSGVMDVLDGDLPLLTLTTCNPQFSNRERMIVHAVLQRAEPRVDGQLPAELVEGV
jgi:LPXTG-site transpeptidase (sortase) family protein